MPEKLTKNKDGTYKVTGPHGVHAKHSTKENAEAQVRLLNAIDHGYDPTKKKHADAPSAKRDMQMEKKMIGKKRMDKEEKGESKKMERMEKKEERVAMGGTKNGRSGGMSGEWHDKRSKSW